MTKEQKACFKSLADDAAREYLRGMELLKKSKKKGRKPASKWATHRVELIDVHGETVEIDVNMVPVIKWLNSLPSVRTRFCCEGEEGKNEPNPYIIFIGNLESLKKILQSLQKQVEGTYRRFAKIEVEWRTTHFEYRLEFFKKPALLMFNEKVLK